MKTTRQSAINYESIEKVLSKSLFITNLKRDATQRHVDQIIDAYKDALGPDDNIFQFLDDFNKTESTDKNKFRDLESNFTKCLKKILKKTKSSRAIYWKPLVGSLYYLIGICQLAQNKDNEAKNTFFEAYTYNDNCEIELISLLGSLYSCLSGNPTTEKILVANRLNLFFKSALEEYEKYNVENKTIDQSIAAAKVIHAMLEKQLKSYVFNREREQQQTELNALIALFKQLQIEKDKKKPNEKKLIEISKKLVQSKYFDHINFEDDEYLLSLFSNIILDQLQEILTLKKNNQGILSKYYRQITDYLIAAMKQHLSLCTLIENILENFDGKNKKGFCQHLKAGLELTHEQIKTDDALFCLFQGDKDLKYLISQLATQQTYKPFKLALTSETFIYESKALVKDVLITLSNDIQPEEHKNQCLALINQFLTTDNNYEFIFKECTNLIASLYGSNYTFANIKTTHGPILDILYYISSLCEIASANGKTAAASYYLNEGLYQPHPAIKDHLHLARAFIRSKNTNDFSTIFAAQYDLNQISDDPLISKLKDKIFIPFAQYIKNQPALNLTENKEITILLNELENAILAGNYKLAFQKQKTFEKYNDYQVHVSHDLEYNFWMTILYFKLHDNSKNKNDPINSHLLHQYPLKNTLLNSPDLLSTLFRFKEVISKVFGNDDHIYLKALCQSMERLICDEEDKDWFSSLIFEEFIIDYCKGKATRHEEAATLDSTKNDETQEENSDETNLDKNSYANDANPENLINIDYEIQSLYQPIDTIIKKFDFVTQIKDLLKPHLVTIINNQVDDNIIKLMNDFFAINSFDDTDILNYKKIEKDCILILNETLQKWRRYKGVSAPEQWYSVIGALYSIIGTCQLAQNKNIEAQHNFSEVYLYSNEEMQIIAKFANCYAMLNGIVTTDDLIKARWYNTNTDKLNEAIKKNDRLNNLFTMLETKINADLNIDITESEKSIKSEATRKCYESWDAERSLIKLDETKIEGLQKELLQNIAYLKPGDILKLFSWLIKKQLTVCVNIKEDDLILKETQRKHLVNLIKEANKYLQFTFVIRDLLRGPVNVCADKYKQLCELKIALEQINNELKIGNLLDSILHRTNDIHTLIKHASPQNAVERFDLKMTPQQFVNRSRSLAQPILMEFATKHKASKNVIDQFLKCKETEDYNSISSTCDSLIKKLFADNHYSDINKKYGPILNVLNYISGLCKIAVADGKKPFLFDETHFNEALYQPPSALKDLALLGRAFLRLKRNWINSGIHDLAEISEHSVCKGLKQEMNDELTKYLDKNKSIKLEKDTNIEIVLQNLKAAIIGNNFESAHYFQKDYEKFDPNKIHPSQETTFHFWMTILYFKKRTLAPANESNKYSERLSIYLLKTLTSTEDLLSTLFHFKNIISAISKDNPKSNLKLFYDDYVKSINQTFFKEYCHSQIFYEYIREICKELFIQEDPTIINETISPPKKIDELKIEDPIDSQSVDEKQQENIVVNQNQGKPPIKQTKKKKKPQARGMTKEENRKLNHELLKAQQEFAKINKIKDEFRFAENQIENLERQIANSKVQLSTVENKLNQANDDLNKIQSEIIEIDNKILKSDDTLSQKKAKIMQLTQEVIQLIENEMSKIVDMMRPYEDKVLFNKNLIASKEKELAPIKTDLGEAEKVLQIADKFNNKESEIKLVENNKIDTRIKIQNGETEIALKDQEITQIAEEISQEQSEILKIEEEIHQTQELIRQEEELILKSEEEKISNEYLNQFFSDEADFKILSMLNKKANDLGQHVVLHGGLAFNWYMHSLQDDESVALASKKRINDIDLYINCIGADYEALRDELMKEPYCFKLIKEGAYFINLNKKLNNGRTIDLSLKIAPESQRKVVPVMCGEAFIMFTNGKHSPILVMNKDNGYFDAFSQACQKREMWLGMPGADTRNNLYLSYKIKDYRGIIDFKNLPEFRGRLYDYYMEQLQHNYTTVYFELLNFFNHDLLNENDKDALKTLRIPFHALFDFKKIENEKTKKIDVDKFSKITMNEFVKYFISCKDVLFSGNIKVFKEQIDLMISLYLQKDESYDLNNIRNEIKKLKLLYLEQIEQPADPGPQVSQTYVSQPSHYLKQTKRPEHYPQYNQTPPYGYQQEFYPQSMQQMRENYPQYSQAPHGHQSNYQQQTYPPQYMQQMHEAYLPYSQAPHSYQSNYQQQTYPPQYMQQMHEAYLPYSQAPYGYQSNYQQQTYPPQYMQNMQTKGVYQHEALPVGLSQELLQTTYEYQQENLDIRYEYQTRKLQAAHNYQQKILNLQQPIANARNFTERMDRRDAVDLSRGRGGNRYTGNRHTLYQPHPNLSSGSTQQSLPNPNANDGPIRELYHPTATKKEVQSIVKRQELECCSDKKGRSWAKSLNN